MKNTICLFILLMTIPYCTHAQGELPSKDGKVIYELVDSSVTATSIDLYNRAKIWFANAFRDSKEVIQVDDKDNTTIMGKGRFRFYQGLAEYAVRFSVKINTKDNKYRVQFYDIITESGTVGMENTAEDWNRRKNYDKIKAKINTGFNELIASLKTGMAKKPDTDF